MLRFLSLILLFSCGSKPSAVPTTEHADTLTLVRSPAVQYPLTDYNEVAFYSVDAKHYKDSKLTPLRKEDQERLGNMIGFAILDSSGNPLYKNIERKELSNGEVKELQSIFTLPENDGHLMENNCMASFRDAFVFYHKRTPVAQVQICFECSLVEFSSDTASLAERFSTDGDWKKLHAFVSRLKAR